MEAIPTKYKGRQYRSRLEARWAAMFDLLGWQVEYEPIDFNGWIPDFVINEASEVFVEVKPVGVFPKEVAEKINRSGSRQEVLIVGHSVPIEKEYLGWLRQEVQDNEWDWSPAAFGLWIGSEHVPKTGRFQIGNPGNVIGFCHSVQSYDDRITGFYDGGSFGSRYTNDVCAIVENYWREAGNLVQWRRPR